MRHRRLLHRRRHHQSRQRIARLLPRHRRVQRFCYSTASKRSRRDGNRKRPTHSSIKSRGISRRPLHALHHPSSFSSGHRRAALDLDGGSPSKGSGIEMRRPFRTTPIVLPPLRASQKVCRHATRHGRLATVHRPHRPQSTQRVENIASRRRLRRFARALIFHRALLGLRLRRSFIGSRGQTFTSA